MDKLNLFQRMSKITEEVGVIAKNLNVQTTRNSSYKAVSERDVIDGVKPIETKWGVYSYPASREVLESHILESESEYQGKVTKKTTFMTRIKTVYRFVNTDNPTEYIETTVFSEGIDSQDKGSGKAMTYGDKYALMKAYKISTGDDPDAQASNDTRYKAKSSENYTPPVTENAVHCKKCGAIITREKDKHTGEWIQPEQVAEYCGGLCKGCYKAEKEAKK